MDTASIFLICVIGAFGSFLIGGRRWSSPLLVSYEKRKSSQVLLMRNRQEGSEAAQVVRESNAIFEKTGSLNWLSWRHLICSSATASTSNRPIQFPPASPVGRLSRTTLQSMPSGHRYNIIEFVVVKDPHGLYNMAAAPPVLEQSLSCPVAEIGTQVGLLVFDLPCKNASVPPALFQSSASSHHQAPPAALLARRSQDTLKSRHSAHSVVSGSNGYYRDIESLRVGTLVSLLPIIRSNGPLLSCPSTTLAHILHLLSAQLHC
jgi:hypothetical protein